MKYKLWQSRAWLVILALVVASSGCSKESKGVTVNQTIASPEVDTHCVGRFLIDLPRDFKLTATSDLDLVYGLDRNFRTVKVKVPVVSNLPERFDSLVAQRVSELAGQHHFKAESKSMLAATKKLGDGAALIRSFDSPDSLEYFKSEIYVRKAGAIALLEADVFDKDRPKDIEAKLIHIADQLQGRGAADLAGKGSCLGPLVVDAQQDGEWLSLSFVSQRWPDVKIGIHINSTVAKSDGGLLKRWDSKQGQLTSVGFKSDTLRRGAVVIGGQPGEQLLTKGQDHDKVTRSFSAETLLTAPAKIAAPSFAIAMDMGGQVGYDYQDASWSEADAVAIWEAMLKSIRLRPGAL